MDRDPGRVRAVIAASSSRVARSCACFSGPSREPLVHTHVACLLGDTFGSLLCDCHGRLEQAAAEIRDRGAGMLIYIKPAFDDPFACPRAGAA